MSVKESAVKVKDDELFLGRSHGCFDCSFFLVPVEFNVDGRDLLV